MGTDNLHILRRGAIGVFDSGLGGLTILKELRKRLPQYDYIYLGDNARAPYGTRSFDIVYQYTKQCSQYLLELGCPMVILACNTASAKALRSIQCNDLPAWHKDKRILGIIRPTAEAVPMRTLTKHIGLFATPGTVNSNSYPIEIAKIDSEIKVTSVACPMWVPLVENGEFGSDGADYFVKKKIEEMFEKDGEIDTVVLACTHYPLLKEKIMKYMPKEVSVISQGEIVAESLEDYFERHTNMKEMISTGGECRFLTTENVLNFKASAMGLLGAESMDAETVTLF